MKRRQLSGQGKWWIPEFGDIVFPAYLVFAFFPDFSRNPRDTVFWVFFGIWVAICWRRIRRVRPYVWDEAYEEADRWIFQRKGEVLEISPSDVEDVLPLTYQRLLVLRLRERSDAHRLVMFIPSTEFHKNKDWPLQLIMRREVTAARKRRFAEERQHPEQVLPPQPMERVSLASSRAYRTGRLLLWCIVTVGGGWMAMSVTTMALSGEWSPMTLGIMFVALMIAFIFHHEFFANLASQVDDVGDALIIRHRGREVRVPLGEIAELDYRPFDGFHWIVLHLRKPISFGRKPERKLAFIPLDDGSLLGWNPRVDSLRERLEQLRFIEEYGAQRT